MKKFFFLFILPFSIIYSQNNMLKMPSVFSDNMVIQQKTNAAFWGTAKPNSVITINPGWGKEVKTSAKKDGSWITNVKTPKAGGPFQITVISENDTLIFHNVLSGEVWLCSGQSNMEMPLGGWPPADSIYTAKEEIANANYTTLRFFTVSRSIADFPKDDCRGIWKECNPENAAAFSAAGFFFGKKLMNDLNVPIGLIHSSWGGTPIESWIRKKYISEIPQYKELVSNIGNTRNQAAKFNEWLSKLPNFEVNTADQNAWSTLPLNDSSFSFTQYDDTNWLKCLMPGNFDQIGLKNFDGVVWFRYKIELPENLRNKELTLSLGSIDDMDVTYVNGVKIGSYETISGWNVPRIYNIPAILTADKTLTIAVRVIDNQQGGGIYSSKDDFYISEKISGEKVLLEGTWKYNPIAEYRNSRIYIFQGGDYSFLNRPQVSSEISAYFPTMLFNGMIAPLIPYKIKGVIWYQGESNTEEPEMYKKLFPILVNNWRSDWNNDLSFYFTQIAPYKYGEGTNSQYLREAQFQSLSIPKTGMAVTLDIGNINNIHPGNKKDVGERLALWALAKDYGKKLECSGPIYNSNKVVQNKMILTFDHNKGLKIIPRNGLTNFEIAGENKTFYQANAEVKNNQLIISAPQVKMPTAVRYCWGDTLEATLFNSAGLPSPSFRTNNW